MNNLEEFSSLTSFMHEEFTKMREVYGIEHIDEKNLKKIFNSVFMAFDISNSNTKKKLKYGAKIDWAIFTAPHSFIWRLFHRRLWIKCQEEIALRKQHEEEERELKEKELEAQRSMLAPGQPRRADLQSLSVPSTITPEERLFLN